MLQLMSKLAIICFRIKVNVVFVQFLTLEVNYKLAGSLGPVVI